MRTLLTGNEAVARGVGLSRVEVVSAYPITPQTSIVEEVAKLHSHGKLNTRYIQIESEHSSMACTAAASMTGVRAFTATSSHGLAYMHEMLHWVSGSRLPVVLVNVNRALGAPWNLWSDHSDSLSQRDTGWLQIYCATNQECLDTVIQAFRLAETILLPVMIVMDGFILSHTLEPVDLPEQAAVDHFLPPYQATYKLDPEAPHVFNAIVDAGEFTRMRRQAQEDMVNALVVIQDVDTAFQDALGRSYGLLETYRLEDAEVVMVAMGAVCGTAKDVVDELRDQDTKVGLVRIRIFRPFPITHLRKLLSGKRKVAVLDQAVSRGSGGILSQEVKQALFHDHHFHSKDMPQVFSYIAGIGGLDITPKMLKRVFEETLRARDSQTEACWMEASA